MSPRFLCDVTTVGCDPTPRFEHVTFKKLCICRNKGMYSCPPVAYTHLTNFQPLFSGCFLIINRKSVITSWKLILKSRKDMNRQMSSKFLQLSS